MVISNIYNSINSFINRLGRPTVSDPLGILTEEDKLRIADEAQRRNLFNQGAFLVSLGQEQFTPQRNILGAVNALTQGDNFVQAQYNQAIQNEMNKMALEDLQAKRGASAEVDERIKKYFQTQPKSIIDDALQLQPQQDTGLGLRMGDAMMQPDNVVQTPGDFIDANIRLIDPSLTDPVGLTMPQVDPLSATDINAMFPSQALTRDVKDLPIQLRPSEKLNINKGNLTEPELTSLDLSDAGFGISEDNELTGESTPVITRSDLLPPIEQQGLQIPKLADIREIETPQDAPITLEGLMSLRNDQTLSNAGREQLETLINYKQQEKELVESEIQRGRDAILFDLEVQKKYKELYNFNDQESSIARRFFGGKVQLLPEEQEQIVNYSRQFDSLPKFQITQENGDPIDFNTMPNSGNILVQKKDFGNYLNNTLTPYGNESVSLKYTGKEKLEEIYNGILADNIDLDLSKSGVNITTTINQGELGKKTQTDIEGKLLDGETVLTNIKSLETLLNKGDFKTLDFKNRLLKNVTNLRDYFGLSVSEQARLGAENYTQALQRMNDLLSAYVKSISGAQVAEAEAQRLQAVLPKEGDSPIVIRAKLATFKAHTLATQLKTAELKAKNKFDDYYSMVNGEIVVSDESKHQDYKNQLVADLERKREEYNNIYNFIYDEQERLGVLDDTMTEEEFFKLKGEEIKNKLRNWSKNLTKIQKEVLVYPTDVNDFNTDQNVFDEKLRYGDLIFTQFLDIYRW